MHSDEAAPPDAGLAGAIRPAQELLDSSRELGEGQYIFQSFELLSAARVHVEIYAAPEPVNVMLMTPSDLDGYREALRAGGGYTYRQALSEKEVIRFDQTEILPEGEWTVVVERPLESLLSPQSTTVDITITVY